MKHDDPIHCEVKLAAHLRTEYSAGVYVQTFENRHREEAMHAILTQLGADRSGLLSENQKRQARIILCGQSRGGSACRAMATASMVPANSGSTELPFFLPFKSTA